MAENDPPRGIRRRGASLFPDVPDILAGYAVPLHLLRMAMAVRDDLDWPGPTISDERATLFAMVLGAAQMNGRGAGAGAALAAGPEPGDARAWRYAARLGRPGDCRMGPAGTGLHRLAGRARRPARNDDRADGTGGLRDGAGVASGGVGQSEILIQLPADSRPLIACRLEGTVACRCVKGAVVDAIDVVLRGHGFWCRLRPR